MKPKQTLLLILALTSITSCVYQPTMVDIPLISQKHELRVDAGVSIIPAVNATVSYGLTDKLAIQTYLNTNTYDSYYLQGAVGYYKNLGNNKIMEIYGGFGSGEGDAYSDANPGNLKGNYQSYFAQFNMGSINGRFAHMESGFGIKTGMLHSNMTDMNYYDKTYPLSTSHINYSDNSFLFEPTFFFRFGGERLKVNFKMGGCWMYKFTNIDKYFPYSRLNLGIGLNYNLK
ncbi:MAG: hypothetical protein PHR83_17250 [Paludibacter sp.]|nr:hypothetical protein [Paludibacter sp.]